MTTLRENLQTMFTQKESNLFAQTPTIDQSLFEKIYIETRQKENRLYSDAVVRQLPEYEGNRHLVREWKLRTISLNRLLRYIKIKPEVRTILEVGCGNGWFSHRLAVALDAEVLGLDINLYELEQASRTFHDIDNLFFLHGDLHNLESLSFDVIVLPASIQYFSDASKLLLNLSDHLNPKGEIHILDSPLYRINDIALAKDRSDKYFSAMKVRMNDYYFHRSWQELKSFNPIVMFEPSAITRMLNRVTPLYPAFPWIKIYKDPTLLSLKHDIDHYSQGA